MPKAREYAIQIGRAFESIDYTGDYANSRLSIGEITCMYGHDLVDKIGSVLISGR